LAAMIAFVDGGTRTAFCMATARIQTIAEPFTAGLMVFGYVHKGG
jgi:hypothetical protein